MLLVSFNIFNIFIYLLLSIVTLVTLLVSVAYFTLAERKIIASVQRRRGPDIVGF
jgi:NADH-quinone oxidoreductase subunit H